MKKIILLSIFIIASFWYSNIYATEAIKVKVTEVMPWMDCWTQDADWKYPKVWWTDENPIYECKVESGFWSVQLMLWGIVKYFTFIAGIAGVLFLVINGIMYSMWDKEEAKKRITKTLIGLIVLFSSWVILNLVAPWIYK